MQQDKYTLPLRVLDEIKQSDLQIAVDDVVKNLNTLKERDFDLESNSFLVAINKWLCDKYLSQPNSFAKVYLFIQRIEETDEYSVQVDYTLYYSPLKKIRVEAKCKVSTKDEVIEKLRLRTSSPNCLKPNVSGSFSPTKTKK